MQNISPMDHSVKQRKSVCFEKLPIHNSIPRKVKTSGRHLEMVNYDYLSFENSDDDPNNGGLSSNRRLLQNEFNGIKFEVKFPTWNKNPNNEQMDTSLLSNLYKTGSFKNFTSNTEDIIQEK